MFLIIDYLQGDRSVIYPFVPHLKPSKSQKMFFVTYFND